MNEVFTIPITTIMNVLLAVLALCLLAVAWVAWRRPVIFKLGARNIPRRRAQTVLIILGLMLSTMITAAALGTGDTLHHSASADLYTNLGHVDELVVASHDAEARNDLIFSATMDPSSLARVEEAVRDDPNVDGVMPMLDTRVPVLHDARQLAEPDVVLTGLDPARLDQFAGLTGADGRKLDLGAVPDDGVVLSKKLADRLEAGVGDAVTLFVDGSPHRLTVAAIARNSYLSGTRRSRGTYTEVPGMAMPLAHLQRLTGRPGEFTAIAVSNTGGVRDGLARGDVVVAGLRRELAGQGLGVDPIKQDGLDDVEWIASGFTDLFVVLALFSIAVGVLLIVLIFTMLASERRAEMGMARAVGAQRSQLIQQYVAEGAGYALAAGLVGTALGVLATIGIAQGMKVIYGKYAPFAPHVEPRSLVVAYCLGVVITLLTVAGSSWKISRLNIAAAVRDIPDVASPRRRRMTLVWAGLLLAGGALLVLAGADASNRPLFSLGMSLLPFGVALGLGFFGVPGRPIVTAIGLYVLAFWLMPESWFERAFGTFKESGIEMFFISGVCMIMGATVLIMSNTDLLLAAVSRLGGLFRSRLPAFRTGVAYPAAARGRTGMTIAMFSLVIFSLVMFATMSENWSNLVLGEDANAGWDVRADVLGGDPIGDFTGALRAKAVDTGRYRAVGRTTNPNEHYSEVRPAGAVDPTWKNYQVYGMDRGFLDGSRLKFQQRAQGYATDADVIHALRTQPNVAVVDALALPRDFQDPRQLVLPSLKGKKVFAPPQVEVPDPRTGVVHTLTVIGVIDGKIGSLVGLYTNQDTIDAIYGATTITSYYVAVNDPDEAGGVAREIEAALLASGVQATSIRDEVEETKKEQAGLLYIIQGFMGLGLLVGVAAVGVIAFRAVVERRQQIGVLRAIGFRREMVALSFLIETGFVVGLGALTGTALGLRLAYTLMTSEEEGAAPAGFLIPWPIILTVLVATVLVALLMTWIPSRQAGRIAPAEALRYE